jgi:hypothetical protein
VLIQVPNVAPSHQVNMFLNTPMPGRLQKVGGSRNHRFVQRGLFAAKSIG